MNYKEVIELQEILAKDYGYKPIPPMLAMLYHEIYNENLPSEFKIEGEKKKLFTKKGTLIAMGYSRIVIGDYGAFIEISKDDIVSDNIIVKHGQEYRIYEERYAKHAKYHWLTVADGSFCKIYFQQHTVEYADYKPNFYYISPYEVTTVKN